MRFIEPFIFSGRCRIGLMSDSHLKCAMHSAMSCANKLGVFLVVWYQFTTTPHSHNKADDNDDDNYYY